MEGFVHIRTLYNYKYWVRKSGEDESKSWIAAEANEPEEDPSKLSCTLFKPILVEGEVDQDGEVAEEHNKPQKIRLVHIDQIGQQGCVSPPDSDLLTLASGKDDEDDDVFIPYNAASVFLLPSRVAFTNHEGKYAVVTTGANRETYVDFNTTDIGQEGVVIRLAQGPTLQPPAMLCRYTFTNWQIPIGSNLITVSGITVAGVRVLYYVTPIRLGGNKIALLKRDEPNLFTNRVAAHGLNQVVGCTATSASSDAIFGVEEPVLLREVSNVVYNMQDSRVYDIRQLDKFRDVRRNATSIEQTGVLSVEYTRGSRITTWDDSQSVANRVAASMSASIPFVGRTRGGGVAGDQSNRYFWAGGDGGADGHVSTERDYASGEADHLVGDRNSSSM